MENRKGQTGGLITGLVFGIAGLVIGVIIALLIVSTLTNADLFSNDVTTPLAITNESQNGETQGIWLNTTIYALASSNVSTINFAITQVWNQSTNTTQEEAGMGGVILSGNYSVNASGFITNASTVEYDNVTVSYTFSHVDHESIEERTIANLSSNLSKGIDNIALQIPTVLLIAAIVLILTVLAVLVLVWQRMRLGGTGAI